MKCFLSSSPTLEDRINPANGFLARFREAVSQNANVLFICSDPDGYERTDFHGGCLRACFENSGFRFGNFRILDHRNHTEAGELVSGADLIILAGGHVPTQNAFFREIGLRPLLEGFRGTILGISAGTMNSAETVYAHPELEGEAVDPAFQRFLPGLGLTRQMVLPHYQMIKDDVLDGIRVFEDIAYPDSMGRKFLCLTDGSFIFSENGCEHLHGEAYLIRNGVLKKISSVDDVIKL